MASIAEKIIANKVGRPVVPGEIIVVDVDGVMATDTTAPFAIQSFQEMDGKTVWDADRVSLVIDHAAPAPNERISNLHMMMRAFAKEQNVRLYEIGSGICHQLMVENGHVRPGEIFLGADSHTPTYGALNAFAVGVGSTDLAAVLLTGQTWIKVPQTLKITLSGALPFGVFAKDVILRLVGQLGIDGATYESVEFHGETVACMTLASRMVLANMVAEMGAKTGIVHPAGLELPYDFEPIFPDDDHEYAAEYFLDVSDLRPQIAAPHSPDNVKDIDSYLGQKVDMAFIGSCTNARLEDLQEAADILKGSQIADGVRLLIAPASRAVMNAALADGTFQVLSEAGASFITSGCGPCVGTHNGVPGNNEVVISSTNRNFQGRMGNPNAKIFLASPAVVAAAAIAGEIIDPVTLRVGV